MAEDKFEKNNDADGDEGNSSQNNGDQEMEDIDESEYTALDQTIDNLNSALNSLEGKNEDLYAKALELLQENQEAHQQILKDKNKENSDKSHDEGKS